MKIINVDFKNKCLQGVWEENFDKKREVLEQLSKDFYNVLDKIYFISDNDEINQDAAIIFGKIVFKLNKELQKDKC